MIIPVVSVDNVHIEGLQLVSDKDAGIYFIDTVSRNVTVSDSIIDVWYYGISFSDNIIDSTITIGDNKGSCCSPWEGVTCMRIDGIVVSAIAVLRGCSALAI